MFLLHACFSPGFLLLLTAETNHLKYNNLAFTVKKAVIYATQKETITQLSHLNILSNYSLAISTHNELIVTFGFVNNKRFVLTLSTHNVLIIAFYIDAVDTK